MRRNSFLTVMFALIPGAGEMFLGYMKKGLSSMCMFFGIIALAAALHMDFMLFALPIVWFYSFFTTLNLHGLIIKGMPLPRDEYNISEVNFKNSFLDIFNNKNNMFIGYILVVIGGISVIGTLSEPLLELLNNYLPNLSYTIRSIIYRLPALVGACAIVFLGIKLVKGGKEKEEKALEENINMYKGQNVVVIENKEVEDGK